MSKVAKLVVGETYHVQGINFEKGKSVEVDNQLAEYLDGKEQFEVSEKRVKKAPAKHEKKEEEKEGEE